MAREVVCAGLTPALGLHHCSQLNAFNLVDDLMEPLRPSIDLLAAGVAGKTCRLSRKQRAALRGANRLSVGLENEVKPIADATNVIARSFRSAVLYEDPSRLILPVTQPVELLSMVGE